MLVDEEYEKDHEQGVSRGGCFPYISPQGGSFPFKFVLKAVGIDCTRSHTRSGWEANTSFIHHFRVPCSIISTSKKAKQYFLRLG